MAKHCRSKDFTLIIIDVFLTIQLFGIESDRASSTPLFDNNVWLRKNRQGLWMAYLLS